MVRKLSAPLFVQIELTEGCNHRCGYCSNPFADERLIKPTIEETDIALSELLLNKVFSVVLTGGEPFTNRPVLHYSIERLADEPTEVYVNTNLSQPIHQPDIERLKKVDYILVSFPSHIQEKFNKIVGANSYQKVVANLEMLASEGVPFGINQVVTPFNYQDVDGTVEFLREKIGLREYSASPVIPTCLGKDIAYSIQPNQVLELAQKLIDIEKDIGVKTDMLTFVPPCFFPDSMMHHRLTAHGCSASRDFATISANGEVRRCALLPESYGNIREEFLKIIWSRMLEFEKPTNNHCSGCLPNEYCAGGCEARATACEGNDPFIKGLPQTQKLNLYKTPKDSDIFTLGRIQWRNEGDDYLIGHGGSYVIGNEALLAFTRGIEGKNFSFGEVKRDLGETGKRLVTYLFNRGLLKLCNSK